MNWRGRTWNIVAAAPRSGCFTEPRDRLGFFGFGWFFDGGSGKQMDGGHGKGPSVKGDMREEWNTKFHSSFF